MYIFSIIHVEYTSSSSTKFWTALSMFMPERMEIHSLCHTAITSLSHACPLHRPCSPTFNVPCIHFPHCLHLVIMLELKIISYLHLKVLQTASLCKFNILVLHECVILFLRCSCSSFRFNWWGYRCLETTLIIFYTGTCTVLNLKKIW